MKLNNIALVAFETILCTFRCIVRSRIVRKIITWIRKVCSFYVHFFQFHFKSINCCALSNFWMYQRDNSFLCHIFCGNLEWYAFAFCSKNLCILRTPLKSYGSDCSRMVCSIPVAWQEFRVAFWAMLTSWSLFLISMCAPDYKNWHSSFASRFQVLSLVFESSLGFCLLLAQSFWT